MRGRRRCRCNASPSLRISAGGDDDTRRALPPRLARRRCASTVRCQLLNCSENNLNVAAQLRWSECLLCDEWVDCPRLNRGQPLSVAVTKEYFAWRSPTGWLTGLPWLGQREYSAVPLSKLRKVDIELGNAYRDTRFVFHFDEDIFPGQTLEFARPWRTAFA